MLKKFIQIMLIILILAFCTSCNKTINDENAPIQIWYYDFENADGYSSVLSPIVSNAKFFCEKNEIPLEIVKYDEKTLSYEDYVLKRNVAAAKGNMIILEDARYIADIANQHADYSRLENYDNLLDNYKNQFCIPLGIGYRAFVLNNNAMEYYGINMEKSIITYEEYLEIKQQMREKGAKFRFDGIEYIELLDYYLIKNNLKFINRDTALLKDKTKFKEALVNISYDLYKNLIENDNNILNYETHIKGIYDKNSELFLYEYKNENYPITGYSGFVNLENSILDTTLAVAPGETFLSPSFYMHKKITNEKIYDVANNIVSEISYLYISDRLHYYSPVFNSEKTKKLLEVNDNWEYIGEFKTRAERGFETERSEKICRLINEVYEMLIKDEETSKQIASYYYSNRNYSNKIESFITNFLYEVFEKNLDYKSEEFKNILNNKVDDFIINFIIYNN